MAIKKAKKPTFTVQMKVVLIADVEVEANSLDEAMQEAKTFTRRDIVSMNESTSECDSKTTIVGAWSAAAWSVEQ